MSRRRQNGEQEFGSDSFLDIIANIVGILIILIVIAGMKVARQPAARTDTVDEKLASIQQSLEPNSPSATAAIEDSVPDDALLADFPELPEVSLPEEPANPLTRLDTNPFANPDSLNLPSGDDTEFQPFEESSEGDLAERTVELNREIDALTLQLENVRLEITSSEQRLDSLMKELQLKRASDQFLQSRQAGIVEESERLRASLDALEEQLINGDKQTRSVEATLVSLTDRQEYITSALRQVALETRQLNEVLEEVAASDEGVDRLQHRISPVSKDATEGELHFRLAGGKVAHIPLDRLLERVRDQVNHRRSVVRKFYRSEGLVGPVGGFRMNYVVERRAVAPLQALQYGQNAFQIQMSRWTIVPAETLDAESVQRALRIGSRFRQIIESAPPETVLTIWLYPRDFSSFGKLRELAHRMNLRVAARPLPEGTPIAGSPNGSHSSSQ